jgi:stress response protein YsnF
MSHAKVVAVYDTATHAEAAVKTLISAGYSSDDISVTQNEDNAPAKELSEPGFWHRLFGSHVKLDDAEAYSRTVIRGGAIVTVRVPESEAPRVIKVLDKYGSSAGAAPTVIVPPPTSAADARRDDEDVVRLAEEELIVGKRQIDAGTTRVRRFIVEKPVEANITLHEEHAEVVRRPISDPDYLKDIDWREQDIEVRETVEEPVVNKAVRITEEIVIRRRGSDHVETIRDVVRQQQLEVERVPVETRKK